MVTNLSPAKSLRFVVFRSQKLSMTTGACDVIIDFIRLNLGYRYSPVLTRHRSLCHKADFCFLYNEPGHTNRKSIIDHRYIHQIKSIEIQRITSTMVSSVKSLLTNLLVAIALLTSSPLFPSVGMYEMSVDVCGGQTDFTPSHTFVLYFWTTKSKW